MTRHARQVPPAVFRCRPNVAGWMNRLRALLSAVLLVSAPACHSEHETTTTQAPGPDTQLSALSREFGFPIPSQAQVLGLKRESGMDDLVRVKVLIPTSSRDHFLAGVPIPAAALRPGVGRLGSDDGFWNPHATLKIRSGTKPLADGRYLLLGIADAAEGTLVFLAKHGT